MGIAATQKKVLRRTGLRWKRPGAASGRSPQEGFRRLADLVVKAKTRRAQADKSLNLQRLPAIGSPREGDHAVTFVFPGSAKLVLHGALHARSHGVLRALSQPQRRLISVLCSPESFQSLGRRWNLKAGCGQLRTQRRLGRNRRGELVLCWIKSERAAYADQCSGCRSHDKRPRIEHDHGFGKTLNVEAIRSVV